MRIKTLILIMIAMGCGLLATIGISQVIDGRGAVGTAAAQTEKIFVAAAEIDIGKAFTTENVRLEEWPKDRIPDGAIKQLEELEGRFARQRLYVGEPIMTMKLMDSNSDTTMTIPEGYRACSIKVSGEVVVGNLVKPGDRVDVIVFLRKNSEVPITGTRTILRDVRIFAVNAKTEREVDEEGQVVMAQTVSLLVTPKQVEMLTLASQLGSLRLSLRRPNDTMESDDSGTSVDSFLEDTPYASAPPQPQNAGGGLMDMLNQMSQSLPPVPAAPSEPEVEEPALPQAAPLAFSMIVHSPQGLTRYDWSDEQQLPSATPVDLGMPQTGFAPLTTPAAPLQQEETENSAQPEETEISAEPELDE